MTIGSYFSNLYQRASNMATTAVETVKNIRREDVNRVAESTAAFFKNTAQGCLQLYLPQTDDEEKEPLVVGEAAQPAETKGEISPDGHVGETWEETPTVILAHQDDLFGPRTQQRAPKQLDLTKAEESLNACKARRSLQSSKIVLAPPP